MVDKGRIQQRETRKSTTGEKRRQVRRKGGRTIQQGEARRVQWETKGDKTIQQRRTRRRTVGDKGRQDPRQGGHTIQQGETRRGTMGDKGRQDLREGGHTIQHQGGHLKKALRTANSTLLGKQEGRQGETKGETRPAGRRTRRTHHPTGRQGDARGDKGRQRETRRETKGDKGRQDPREGGHTIQHQGGHLKKALRTPSSALFGEKLRDSDRLWKLRCSKSACRCGVKHISKSKCTKHTMLGPLLEVEMLRKCTPRSTF